MTWTDLATATLLAIAFLIIPGLLVTLAAGLRGFLAIALAPAVSTTAIAVGAIGAGAAGLAWSWPVVLVTAAVVAGLAWLVMAGARRLGFQPAPAPDGDRVREWPLWCATALAASLLTSQLVRVLGRPDAFSQTFDNIFHLSAIRYALETGNASSLQILASTRGEPPFGFYPAAFHDLVVLVLQVHPAATITVALNATIVALAAVVWPLSLLAFVRLAFRLDAATTLSAGVVAAAFVTFPLLLLDFGVLYPNMHAYALVPALWGLLIVFLRTPGAAPLGLVQAGGLFLVSVPGLLLAHPNAFMALLAISIPPVVGWSVRRWRDTRALGARAALVPAATLVAVLVGTAVAWKFVRPPEEAASWPPIVTAPQAVGEALLSASPGGGRAAWLLGALLIVGIVAAIRGRRWWLVGSWGIVAGLWVVVGAFGQGRLRTLLTGVWYNDPWRFSATLPLVAAPLVIFGIQALVRACTDRLPTASAAARLRRTIALTSVGAVAIASFAVGTQRAGSMRDAVTKAAGTYALTDDSPLVNTDEYALLMRVPQQVPAGGVVATNPWNGSSMLYPLTGVPTTTTHVLYTPTADQTAIRMSLDEVASSPEACASAMDLGITHALDFGTQEIHYGKNPYPGFDDLATAAGFRLVDREGTAALYELTVCRR